MKRSLDSSPLGIGSEGSSVDGLDRFENAGDPAPAPSTFS